MAKKVTAEVSDEQVAAPEFELMDELPEGEEIEVETEPTDAPADEAEAEEGDISIDLGEPEEELTIELAVEEELAEETSEAAPAKKLNAKLARLSKYRGV